VNVVRSMVAFVRDEHVPGNPLPYHVSIVSHMIRRVKCQAASSFPPAPRAVTRFGELQERAVPHMGSNSPSSAKKPCEFLRAFE
jgi:hypothetical protein